MFCNDDNSSDDVTDQKLLLIGGNIVQQTSLCPLCPALAEWKALCGGNSQQIIQQYDIVWCCMVWQGFSSSYSMVWHGTVWYEMVRYNMVWYVMVWFDTVTLAPDYSMGIPTTPQYHPFQICPPPSLLCKLFVSKVHSWIIHSLGLQLT